MPHPKIPDLWMDLKYVKGSKVKKCGLLQAPPPSLTIRESQKVIVLLVASIVTYTIAYPKTAVLD